MIRPGRAALLVAVWATPAVGQLPRPGQDRDPVPYVIVGTVVDARGQAIPDALVRVVAGHGTTERATRTSDVGRYALRVPLTAGASGAGVSEAPRFELRAQRIGYRPLVVMVEPRAAGDTVRRDFALADAAARLAVVRVTDRRPTRRPAQARTPGGADESGLPFLDERSAVDPGNLAQLAGLQAGVTVRRSRDGLPPIQFAGQPAGQTGLTLDGAGFGATALPTEALASVAIVRSTFDPARGQFSSGQVAATTRGGSNLPAGALRARIEPSALELRPDPLAPSDGRVLRLDGGAGGAIRRDRAFWYAAAQVARRDATPGALGAAGDVALRARGVDPGALAAVQATAHQLGFAPTTPAALAARSTTGIGLLRLDVHPTDRAILLLRLDGSGTVNAGGLGRPVAAGQPGRTDHAGAGALVQVTSYAGPVRNEARMYGAGQHSRQQPGDMGPGAVVGLGDAAAAGPSFALDDQRARVGDPLWAQDRRQSFVEISDELLVRLGAGGHRLKAGGLYVEEGARVRGTANAAGTYYFANPVAFAAASPLAYTRDLWDGAQAARVQSAAVFAAHLWTVSPRVRFVSGLRGEGRRVAGAGREWALVVAPRAGFELSPSVRSTVRGGVGQFVGRLLPGTLAAALAESGRTGPRQLACYGAVVPTPAWRTPAPTTCAGESVPALASVPLQTVLPLRLPAPSTWQASVSASHDLPRVERLGFVSVSADLTRIVGSNQPIAADANRRAAAFVLAGEGRPVYVPASSIDAQSGGVPPAASRMDQARGVVRVVSTKGRSATWQARAAVTALTPATNVYHVEYAFTAARDIAGRVPAPGTFAAALATPGAADGFAPADGGVRHRIVVRPDWRIGRHVEFGGTLQIESGGRFTPMVDGDVDGDGFSNDPAFVPLTDSAPDSDKLGALPRCLARQRGRLAARNSCALPWAVLADVQASVTLPRRRSVWRAPLPATLLVTITNLPAAVDRLLHGESRLRGWGNPAAADPMLLRVRGFDPAAGRFLYTRNATFGALRGAASPWATPFRVSVQARWTFGADPARQAFDALVRPSARAVGDGTIEDAIRARVPNVPLQVVTADTLAGLRLTPDQRRILRVQADSLEARLLPVVTEAAAARQAEVAAADDAARRAARRALAAAVLRLQAGVAAALEEVRGLLSPEQWRRLPNAIRVPALQLLPPTRGVGGGADPW